MRRTLQTTGLLPQWKGCLREIQGEREGDGSKQESQNANCSDGRQHGKQNKNGEKKKPNNNWEITSPMQAPFTNYGWRL